MEKVIYKNLHTELKYTHNVCIYIHIGRVKALNITSEIIYIYVLSSSTFTNGSFEMEEILGFDLLSEFTCILL